MSIVTAALGLLYLGEAVTASNVNGVVWNLLVWAWIGVLLPLLVWRRALRIEVLGDVLELRFSPWNAARLDVKRITDVQITSYYPKIDGGWGVSRGRALRLYLDGGDFILVGTKRPEELAKALGCGRRVQPHAPDPRNRAVGQEAPRQTP